MTAARSDFFKTERTASEIKLELLPRVFEIFVTSLLLESKPHIPVLCLDLLADLDVQCRTSAVAQWLRQVYSTTNTRLDLNQTTQLVLYNTDKSALAELQEHIEQLPFYQELKHLPVVLNHEADEALFLDQLEEESYLISILNPFTNSLSQEILLRVCQKEQSDLFMFFPLQDMKAALKKKNADSHLLTLFGDRLTQIKDFQKKDKNPERREEYLINSFEGVFKDKGFLVFRFRINVPDKKQTSHYLVFASKSEHAYTRLKELMSTYSDFQEDGVPLFGANLQQQQTTLFHEHYRFSVEGLVQEFSQKVSMYNNKTLQQIYEKHSLGTYYTLDNYRLAFDKLMRLGKVRFINPKTGQPISKLTPTSLIRFK